MGAQGTITVDYGPTPGDEQTVTVSGQTAILASSLVECWIMGATNGSSDEVDHLMAGQFMKTVPGIPVAGSGFTIYTNVIQGLFANAVTVCWVWN